LDNLGEEEEFDVNSSEDDEEEAKVEGPNSLMNRFLQNYDEEEVKEEEPNSLMSRFFQSLNFFGN
jgi:hypothetical protein